MAIAFVTECPRQLRRTITDEKNEAKEAFKSLQDEMTTVKTELSKNQKSTDEQVQVNKEKIERIGQTVVDLSNRKRSHSSDSSSSYVSKSGSGQSAREE